MTPKPSFPDFGGFDLCTGPTRSQFKVPKRGQFHAAIRMTPKRRDSCAQGALERRIRRYRSETLRLRIAGEALCLVAQCSATPATVAATPPCSATPFQTTKYRCDTCRHRGGEVRHQNFRGCSATPVLHLQNAIKSRKSAATRVARHV